MFQLSFTIVFRREKMRQYLLAADTVQTCNGWIEAIKRARLVGQEQDCLY